MNAVDGAPAPIRVLFFAPALGGGGAEKHLVRVANHLERDRFQVAVAVARGGGAYEGELAQDVTLHNLKAGHVARTVRPLRELFRRERPEIVCSFMDHANCAALAATARLPGAPPIVAGVQTVPSISLRHGLSLHGRLVLALVPWLYRRATHVVALSRGVMEDVNRLAPATRGRSSVIPNAGLDDSVLHLAEEAPPAPPAAPKGPVIVACGRLTPVKAFDSLLRALALVRRRVPAQLRIVGDGELRGALETEAARLGVADAVWFTGYQANPYSLMRAADLFVLSSLWEGFGNVIVEAMAVGTAVVSVDCPYGPREIIRHETNGLLTPPRDEAALAGAMVRVLEDAALRARLARGGLERARQFSAPEVALRYGELFAEVVRSRGRIPAPTAAPGVGIPRPGGEGGGA